MSKINALPFIQSLATAAVLTADDITANMEREFVKMPEGYFAAEVLKCGQLTGVLSLGKRKLATYCATEQAIHLHPTVNYDEERDLLEEIRAQIISNSIFAQAVSEVEAMMSLNMFDTGVRSCGREFTVHSRNVISFMDVNEEIYEYLNEKFIGKRPPGVNITPFTKYLLTFLYMSVVGSDYIERDSVEEVKINLERILKKLPKQHFAFIVFGSGTQYWDLMMDDCIQRLSDQSFDMPDDRKQELNAYVDGVVNFLQTWFNCTVYAKEHPLAEELFVIMPIYGEKDKLEDYVEKMYAIGANREVEKGLLPTYALVEGLLRPDAVFGQKITEDGVTSDGEQYRKKIAFGDFLFDSPMVIHRLSGDNDIELTSTRMVFNKGCTNMRHIWKNATGGSKEPVPSLDI